MAHLQMPETHTMQRAHRLPDLYRMDSQLGTLEQAILTHTMPNLCLCRILNTQTIRRRPLSMGPDLHIINSSHSNRLQLLSNSTSSLLRGLQVIMHSSIRIPCQEAWIPQAPQIADLYAAFCHIF